MSNEVENVKSAMQEAKSSAVVDSNGVVHTHESNPMRVTNESENKQKMRVYRKKSTFKGATETDFWYSATRSDGLSVICSFKCEIPTKSSAFEISNIIGNVKSKVETVKGIEYTNLTYYIQSCDFSEIEGVDLPI